MATKLRSTTTPLAAADALALAAAERAKRASTTPTTTPTPTLTVAQRTRLAMGGKLANERPLSADERERRERCKRSRSIVRKYMRALEASTNDANDADVRAHAAGIVDALAERYDAAVQQLAAERKR